MSSIVNFCIQLWSCICIILLPRLRSLRLESSPLKVVTLSSLFARRRWKRKSKKVSSSWIFVPRQNLRIILYAIIHRGGRRNGRGEERITLARRKLGMARVPKNNKARPLEKIGKMGGGGEGGFERNRGKYLVPSRQPGISASLWLAIDRGNWFEIRGAMECIGNQILLPSPLADLVERGGGGGQSPCFLPPPDFLRLFSEWGDRNRDETRRFSAVFFQNFYPPCSGGGGNSQVRAQVSYCLGAQVFMGGRWGGGWGGNTVP